MLVKVTCLEDGFSVRVAGEEPVTVKLVYVDGVRFEDAYTVECSAAFFEAVEVVFNGDTASIRTVVEVKGEL